MVLLGLWKNLNHPEKVLTEVEKILLSGMMHQEILQMFTFQDSSHWLILWIVILFSGQKTQRKVKSDLYSLRIRGGKKASLKNFSSTIVNTALKMSAANIG